MTKIILITTMSLFGCFGSIDAPATIDTGDKTTASLKRSSDSLDRTLVSMQHMIEDMERMNNNLDAIFKAVTDCKTTPECEALKAGLYEKHLQENANKITE